MKISDLTKSLAAIMKSFVILKISICFPLIYRYAVLKIVQSENH